MKASIRTKFSIGILFFFLIIAVLSVFSAIFLTRLSKKTSDIYHNNHASVVYARDMSEGLLNINQEITQAFLTGKVPDSLTIAGELSTFAKTLQMERNNITEPGEDQLVSDIEKDFAAYRDSVWDFIRLRNPVTKVLSLQMRFATLNQQLMLLSEINGKAIEQKTQDATISAKRALTQMTLLGTLCFLIALSFTFRFASYFNERFFQLYNGIKEIVASNYGQRLYFEGNDEFHELSLVFNQMAEQLDDKKQKGDWTLPVDPGKNNNFNDLQELKRLLIKLQALEEQSKKLLARLENNK